MRTRPIAFVAFCGLLLAALPSQAQQCNDFEQCTSNDMCSDGECTGTPANGGSCDDGNPCTVNDTCVSGQCMGTPSTASVPCGNGCGMCTAGFCIPNIANNGQPCNDGLLCTTNDRCQFGVCFGDFRFCPDPDGNPCTADFCNPQTGQCETSNFPPCPPCTTCRPATGGPLPFACEPGPNGGSCDDFNECTGNGTCTDGECQAGPPGTPSGATPTSTPMATATLPLATPTDVSACVGDCDGNGEVSVDEIITAVNIALGNRPVEDCPAADGNSDSDVTVDEIITAVNNALNGC